MKISKMLAATMVAGAPARHRDNEGTSGAAPPARTGAAGAGRRSIGKAGSRGGARAARGPGAS
jgi:hypothetical protein